MMAFSSVRLADLIDGRPPVWRRTGSSACWGLAPGLGHLPAAGGLPRLLRRRLRRDQARAVRRARGRERDHRLLRRVLGHEVRALHDLRVRRGGGALAAITAAIFFGGWHPGLVRGLAGSPPTLAPSSWLAAARCWATFFWIKVLVLCCAPARHPLDLPALPLRPDPDAGLEDPAADRRWRTSSSPARSCCSIPRCARWRSSGVAGDRRSSSRSPCDAAGQHGGTPRRTAARTFAPARTATRAPLRRGAHRLHH